MKDIFPCYSLFSRVIYGTYYQLHPFMHVRQKISLITWDLIFYMASH